MAKPKKETGPVHKMGKSCGYEEHPDGSIDVAPMYAERMERALIQEEAVNSLLRAVTGQCSNLMVSVVTDRRDFWDRVKEDYGLDFEKYDYSYSRNLRRIVRKEKAV